MPADDAVLDAVDGELVLALELRPDGFPPQLPARLVAELEELAHAAREYAAAAQADNTKRAYESDRRHFAAWCARYEFAPMPATVPVVTLYVTALATAGKSVATIRRRAAAVARAHREAGELPPTSDPDFRKVLEGISRVEGTAPKKKTALLRDQLQDMIAVIETDTNVGLRDRALILVGFALALRRSELVALQVEDLTPSPDGMVVRIARSKTDQQARGHELLLVYGKPPNPCPVRALRAWLDASGLTTGPVFRRVTRTGAVSSPLQPQAVATIIKRRATHAGLPAKDFAGHSLRSGYATQAARDGHSSTQIGAVTRHKDQRVLAGYIQAGKGAEDIATVL